MKRLARRQKELQEKTEEMVRQLRGCGAVRPRRSARPACKWREPVNRCGTDSRARTSRNKRSTAQRGPARAATRPARKPRRSWAASRSPASADLIRPLKERQEALNAETPRFQENVQRKKMGSCPSQRLLAQRRVQRSRLGAETADVAEKRLTKRRCSLASCAAASEAMTEAGERMHTVAQQPVDPGSCPTRKRGALQRLAQRRSTQVVDALKEAAEKMEQAKAGGGGGGGDEATARPRAGRPATAFRPWAQLKLLRDLQKDINQCTESFKKSIPI